MRARAAIVGGGIGGLAAAGALSAAGWEVVVHERDAALPAVGTALGIWPSALAALDRLGVGAAVRAEGVAQTAARFLRPDGSRLGTMDVDRLRHRAGDAVHLISRPALLGLLAARVPAGAVRFGAPVTAVDELRAEGADLVVAADGVFSAVRRGLLGAGGAARYAGTTVWRGTVDGPRTEGLTEVWGAGAKFGTSPQEGGRTNWYAAAAAAAGTFTPGREAVALRERFGGWGGPVPAVLAAVTEDGILRHDLYVAPPLASYVHGPTVLIGDAAHAMTPDLGRGACEAVVDAEVLADCLCAAATLEAGLRAFDRRRRRVTRRLARTAAAASWLSRRRRGLPMRDAVLRAALLLPPPP